MKQRLERIQNPATNMRVGYCLAVIDLFMAKTVANREKDREFNIALLQHGYVTQEDAVDMVALMPVDDSQKKAMRARIRRWVKLLQERGFQLPR